MNSETPKSQSQTSREKLRELTETVRPLVEAGQFETVNDALIAVHYRSEEHQTFNTYQGWKKENMQVVKGSKAFLVWARPKDIIRKNEETEKEEKQSFFPVAYLFSNAQLAPREISKDREVNPDPEEKHRAELQKIRTKRTEKSQEPER